MRLRKPGTAYLFRAGSRFEENGGALPAETGGLSPVFAGRSKETLFMKLRFIALLIALPALAHHGSTAYDTSKPVVFKDVTVLKFLWANPHAIITFDAKDSQGVVQRWAAEAGTPQTLTLAGWSSSSVKAGDVISVYVYQAKSGKPVGRLNKIVLADGTELKDSALGYKEQE